MAATYSYGSAPTYTKIATQTLGSAAATVTFSSIPNTYTDLIMVISGKASSVSQSLRATFNGDTASNYSTTLLSGNGTTATSSRETSRSDGILFGVATLSNNSSCIYQIFNYSNTTTYKTVIGRRGSGTNANIAADVGLWRNTEAINTIAITLDGSQNIAAGSTFILYGIKAALVPKATGGDLITTNGIYWYHTFINSGVFFPNQSLSCDCLVVAGGGAGGSGLGGSAAGSGGGAGGFRTGSALSTTSNTAYTVTVGAGGSAVTNSDGTQGSNSIFSTVTSAGGGFGVNYDSIANGTAGTGTNGGSGSGGGASSGVGRAGGISSPVTSPVQGYAGGTGWANATGAGGGGGGGAVGANASSSTGGAGGAGAASSLSGTSITYAGGGGGGGTTTRGAAGTGGGGQGGQGSGGNGSAGTANLGGGGGGGSMTTTAVGQGGNGGSGIVIVRYAV